MITVGSLFAGIGGLDLGLERAGMQVKWQVENDPYCIRVLEKHWPDVKRYGNVRGLTGDELEGVDLICGGFPCQPVSHAGQRRGTADERWLWPEFARIVRKVGPRWVLVENVPGLLSIDSGGPMGEVLRDLAVCGNGIEWDCISAASVGALHRRDRIFILAHTDLDAAGMYPRAVPEEDGVLRGQAEGNIPSGCREILAHAPGAGKREGNFGLQRAGPSCIEEREARLRDVPDSSGPDVPNSQSLRMRGGSDGRSRGQEPDRIDSLYQNLPNPKSIGLESNGATSGISQARTRGVRVGYSRSPSNGSDSEGTERSGAVFTWAGRAGLADFRNSVGADQWAVEPDVGRVADGVPSRVDRLRCLGNAVVPQVAEYIGRLIVRADRRVG